MAPTVPFSDFEKRFLLAEVIKSCNIPLDVLASFVEDASEGELVWADIGFPAGRTLNECMAVYEALTGTGEAPALAPRTPAGGVVAPRLIFASGARRRDESASDYLPSAKTGTGRAIKPKPDSNGTPTTTPKTPYSGKKRGRPSKAELAARAKAQAEAEGGAETGDKGNAVNEGVSTAAEGASSKRRKISTTESLSVDSPDALAGAAATGGPIQTPTPVKRGRGRPPKSSHTATPAKASTSKVTKSAERVAGDDDVDLVEHESDSAPFNLTGNRFGGDGAGDDSPTGGPSAGLAMATKDW